jgi:ATP-dependent DNA ligase
MAQGLANDRAGAVAYLQRYGKSIGAAKVVKFAVQAETMGKRQFAAVMWEKAFELETGNRETFRWPDDAEDVVLDQLPEALPDAFDDGAVLTSFPDHLKPGKVATLQPQDIEGETQEHKWQKILKLTKDPTVWVQQKIDGMRLLVFIGTGEVFYQKRSLRLMEAPNTEMHDHFIKLGEKHDVILDGELTWHDVKGGQHRTAAQAATANETIFKEQPYYRNRQGNQVNAHYHVFDCIYFDGEDLHDTPYDVRWDKMSEAIGGGRYYRMVKAVSQERGQWVQQAAATNRKRKFIKSSRDRDMEGVVLRFRGSPYRAGKSDTAYRHKWLEERDLVIEELTATSVRNRPFGAIKTKLGSVGTGFSQSDMEEINQRFEAREELTITVRSQGLTEGGGLWHPRFIRIVE